MSPTGCMSEDSSIEEKSYKTFCCWEKEYKSWYYARDKPFFKLQNTWSADWGVGGHTFFLAEGDFGTCQMNRRVFYVEP